MKRLLVMSFVIVVVAALFAVPASASTRIDVSGVEDTGYAMGQNGADGTSMELGEVAMHPEYPNQCLDGPCRPYLPFGTRIYMTSPSQINIKIDDGDLENGIPATYSNYTSFTVGDLGDLDYRYSSDNYWIDIYFGRWIRAGQTCECWGVSGSFCYSGQTNSCTNATDYGRHFDRSYYFFQ